LVRCSAANSIPYSITSSARASTVGGISRPSASAVVQIDDEIEFGRLLDWEVPSSYPVLADAGSCLATDRVRKKRLEHQAHSRFDIRGGCGLPVATRAES
jgi:hypothetical protein